MMVPNMAGIAHRETNYLAPNIGATRDAPSPSASPPASNLFAEGQIKQEVDEEDRSMHMTLPTPPSMRYMGGAGPPSKPVLLQPRSQAD